MTFLNRYQNLSKEEKEEKRRQYVNKIERYKRYLFSEDEKQKPIEYRKKYYSLRKNTSL